MIDQERVREMTKLAAYEQREGKRYQMVNQYFRGDYVSRHLLKGFLSGTFCFGIFLLLWGVCHMEELLDNLSSIDFMQFGIAILIRYLFFLAVYLAALDIYANVCYAAGKKSMKRQYRRLKRLGRIYKEQEGRQAPMQH